MHFIVLIQSLLVLSWWSALGSITCLVVSDFDCVITEDISSNSASISGVLCMTELCTSCLLNPDQTFSTQGRVYTCPCWHALQMCDSIVGMQTLQTHSAAFFFYFLNIHTCIQAFSRRKQNVHNCMALISLPLKHCGRFANVHALQGKLQNCHFYAIT